MKRNNKGTTLLLSILSVLCTTCIGVGVVAVAGGGLGRTDKQQAQQTEESKPFAELVRVGDVIAVPEIDADVEYTVQIITPSGKVYSGEKFTVSEAGKYQLEYLANGTVLYTLSCNAIRSATDLVLTNAMASVDGICNYIYNEDPAYKGVAVNVNAGAVIDFDYEINLTRMSKYDLLFEGIVEPSQKGEADFRSMVLTFTDVEDEDSYITVNIVDGHADGGTDKQVGFINAAGPGQTSGGYNYDGKGGAKWQFKDIYGTGVVASFRAEVYASGYSEYSYKLYYDYAENALYSFRWGTKALVTDFDDPVVYGGSTWSGFKSGRVKLSISFKDVKAEGGRVIINNVGGISMTQSEIIDAEAPELLVDLCGESKAPNAPLGKEYSVFPYSVFDFYDSNVKVDVTVTHENIFTGAKTDVYVRDGKFVTDKLGKYTIRYQATDFSGNFAVQEYTFDCVATEEEIQITGIPRSQTATIFEPVQVPTLKAMQVSGGFGILKTSVKAVNPKGDEFALSDWSFTPDMLGEYRLVYKAEDFYGTSKTAILRINVGVTDKIILLNDIVLPELLISKFTYTIPEITAKACKGEEVVNCNVEYVVNGTPLGADRTFTVEAGAETLTIEARAYLEGTDKSETISVTKQVVDGLQGKNRIEYFYDQSGNVTVTENRNDITLTTAKDALVQFANKLNGESFLLSIAYDVNKTKFTSFDITLNDAVANRVSVTLSLKFTESGVTVTTPFGAPSSFQNADGYIEVHLDCNGGRLSDANARTVAVLNKYDSGADFAGFEDGVYMQLAFKGVSEESSLTFNKLNNQFLGYIEKNESDRGDAQGPELEIAGELVLNAKVGDTITVYSCRAYDVYNQINRTTVIVQAPSGEFVVPEQSADQSFDLKLTERGEYTVYYAAYDSLGNRSREPYSINVVNDVPPTLKVSGKDMTKSVGDTVKIPAITVTDDLGEAYYDVFLSLPNSEVRLLVHYENGVKTSYLSKKDDSYPDSFKVSDNSFKLEMKGKYVLTIMAYDSDMNITMKSYTITVK